MKPISEFHKADTRFELHYVLDQQTLIHRPIEIADLYALVEPLTLSPVVPDRVRAQFELARDTFVHSWYVYEFATLAEQQAYAALEAALRHKYHAETGKPADRPHLKGLFDFAIARGWIAAADFEYDMPGAPDGKESVLDTIRQVRNNLTPGKFHLMLSGSHRLMQACHHIICRLFPEATVDTPEAA